MTPHPCHPVCLHLRLVQTAATHDHCCCCCSRRSQSRCCCSCCCCWLLLQTAAHVVAGLATCCLKQRAAVESVSGQGASKLSRAGQDNAAACVESLPTRPADQAAKRGRKSWNQLFQIAVRYSDTVTGVAGQHQHQNHTRLAHGCAAAGKGLLGNSWVLLPSCPATSAGCMFV